MSPVEFGEEWGSRPGEAEASSAHTPRRVSPQHRVSHRDEPCVASRES